MVRLCMVVMLSCGLIRIAAAEDNDPNGCLAASATITSLIATPNVGGEVVVDSKWDMCNGVGTVDTDVKDPCGSLVGTATITTKVATSSQKNQKISTTAKKGTTVTVTVTVKDMTGGAIATSKSKTVVVN